MVELKPGVPVYGLLQQMTQLRAQLGNSQSAFDATDGQRYFLTSLEAIESTFSHNFQHQDWYDQLYSPGYWAIRAMTPDTTRPSSPTLPARFCWKARPRRVSQRR